MTTRLLSTMRFASLLFLLPGLAGLMISATISTHYRGTLPKLPVPEELRITARNISGVVVYQTAEEDRSLSLIEHSSAGILVIGLILSAVYLEKRASLREACVFRSMWAPDSIRSGHQFLFDVGSNSVVMWAALFDSP